MVADKEAEKGIDFYNVCPLFQVLLISLQRLAFYTQFFQIQYYNQGTGVYEDEDCSGMFGEKVTATSEVSVFDINRLYGVDLAKLVVGKPLRVKDASSGHIAPATFGKCLKKAVAKGWTGGFMYWQWNPEDGPLALKAIGA